MKKDRDVKAPDLFVQDYELIFLVMSIIQSELRRGRGFKGDCHSVARALVKSFPNFRVADGYIPRMVPPTFDEKFGVRAVTIVEQEEGKGIRQAVRLQLMYHSWLVWKEDEKFIIDPWPLGGLYGCSPPVAHPQDEYDIIYTESKPPGMFNEQEVLAFAEKIHQRVKKVLDELSQAFNGTSQKTPS